MSSRFRTDRSGIRAAATRGAAALLVALAYGACSREGGGDGPQLIPGADMTQQGVAVRTSDLRAGGTRADVETPNPYEGDNEAMAAGRGLYSTMNCAGCHGGNGGGGMGPPFADAEWIYGSNPENIVQSILQGRPNGMPAFGGKLPASEAWKLAMFVRGLQTQGGAGGGEEGEGSETARRGTSQGRR